MFEFEDIEKEMCEYFDTFCVDCKHKSKSYCEMPCLSCKKGSCFVFASTKKGFRPVLILLLATLAGAYAGYFLTKVMW